MTTLELLNEILITNSFDKEFQSILNKYTLVDKFEEFYKSKLPGKIIENKYTGPLNFKGKNSKICEATTHIFDCQNMTRTCSVGYIRYISKYNKNNIGHKSTLCGVEVYPI